MVVDQIPLAERAVLATYRGDSGARIAEEVAKTITARHLQTSRDDFVSAALVTPTDAVRDQMRRGGFDYVPVIDGGEIIGRCSLHAATERGPTVADVYEQISTRFLVSGDAALDEMMAHLADEPWLLVIDGRRIGGLVTPSDLNRQAARIYFYGMVAAAETRLAEAVRGNFDDFDEVLPHIPNEFHDGLRATVVSLRSADVSPDFVAVFYFTTLLHIAASSDAVREWVGISDASWWDPRRLERLNAFRRSVMHPVKALLDDRGGLSDLMDRVGDLTRIATASATMGVR